MTLIFFAIETHYVQTQDSEAKEIWDGMEQVVKNALFAVFFAVPMENIFLFPLAIFGFSHCSSPLWWNRTTTSNFSSELSIVGEVIIIGYK